MDEFDFDGDSDSPESSSRLGAESSPIKKCPLSSSSTGSISGASSSGSPLRRRTKNRKTRKVILSGAEALKEGQGKRRQSEQEAATAKAAAGEKKKRAAVSTPSSHCNEQMKRQSSPEAKVIMTKGRRHKQRKTERKNNNSASADCDISTEYACSQSSLDSKSVRFADSSKGIERHNYQAERGKKSIECESGSSSASGRKIKQLQQTSSCLRTKPIYPPSSSQNTKTNASKETPPTSPASNSSISYSSFARIHGNGRKKRHKPRRFQLGYSPTDSSHPHDSSVNSSPASSSSKSPQKTQVVTLGRSIGYSSRDFDTTPDAAAATQNAGNYRMLIDELSYLCSAILHCKQQHRVGLARVEVVCKHNSITAGAACDIGELISQSGTRTALLMLSSSGGRAQHGKSNNGGKNVGALGAILEALACAPPVVDWVDVCKEVIIGVEVNELKPSELVGDLKATEFELDSNNLAVVPLSSLAERTKFDRIASKALSIVSLFVSIDCTGSSRAAITPSCKMERNMIKGARNSILQHQQSLRGIARLVSDDPVVNTYLQSVSAAQGVAGVNAGDELQLVDNVDEGSIASKSSRTSTLSSVSMSKASSQQTVDETSQSLAKNADPTKAGRHRSRKRKKLMAIREADDEKESEFAMSSAASTKSSESPVKPNSPAKSGKSNCLDFDSAGSSAKPKPSAFPKKVRLNSVEKYAEKLSLALSRAKIPKLETDVEKKSDNGSDLMCQYCQVWGNDTLESQSCFENVTSSSLAMDAAQYIITGKDSSSGDGADDAEMDEDDGDSDDDDFLGNGNQNPGTEVSSKNPILFANEMLRKSGSLPDYSRAYASTLSAILLAHKSHGDGDESLKTCHRCIAYLQKRASSLSGIIDSLCCLSPKASIALSCPESYLVPGLLKVVADLSFGNNVDAAPTSIRDEILTSLKTLTSLTHENPMACEQVVRPYNWDNSLPTSIEHTMVASDQKTTGVCIIFSYLLKAASAKQGNDDDIDKSRERYLYDTTIFCLNILTNIVEMVPHSAKHMIEHIAINDEGVSAIPWLTRWIVSSTSGFRKSIMKGSFGSQGETEESASGDELKAGEEGNLVTAGNGFVLLAYLMLEDEPSSSSVSIRDVVIKELPIDESGASGGIQYMIKTLKAFCNFYHYSVGDLSVAVIAPIVKLIAGLQKLDVAEQRKTWL
eukprot:scaffold1089_cov131-Skeletonema_menzelii.AAC.11